MVKLQQNTVKIYINLGRFQRALLLVYPIHHVSEKKILEPALILKSHFCIKKGKGIDSFPTLVNVNWRIACTIVWYLFEQELGLK